MRKTLKLTVAVLCLSSAAWAQEPVDSTATGLQDETAFTFTEAQLEDDESASQNITIISSNRNVYANEVGYRFSPARFKYRAYNAKYNEMYINGNPVNDIERGQFGYSFIGGLNNQTRGRESSLPFEDNNYSMSALGGSGNYNFRPSSFATGQRASVAFANRSYNVRAMYTYNSGVTESGWAYTGSLTYRWGNGIGTIQGTSYNSLSYFFGAEKLINDQHSVSLVTWGNPTERGAQRGATDEMYWIANTHNYNPNWGYQDGKKRNSRIVKDFSPAALLTWDWKIDEKTKLITSLLGKYSMYSNSRLAYNGGTNPDPDYYSLMPSFNFNVWNPDAQLFHDEAALANWQAAYDYLSAREENRQVNWDRMYYANSLMAAEGQDAMYYLQRAHDDQLTFSLATKLDKQLTANSSFSGGLQLANNTGMHYQTMDDLLGNAKFHNANTYAIKDFGTSPEVFYDLNDGAEPKEVKVGDKFGYDYNLLVNKAQLWGSYAADLKTAHFFVSGRVAGTTMQRDGKMRNGMAPDNSYGKGKTAKFLDGGAKAGTHLTLGHGHAIVLGAGYEWKTPAPRTAFAAAQINNDFVENLKNEKILSAEAGYQWQSSRIKLNINGYYAKLKDVTEQSLFYSDIESSFAYVSLTGIEKEYYGVELGMNIKTTDWLDVKLLGTISEAKYTSNANMCMTLSNKPNELVNELCITDGMREGGTPLNAFSIDLSYHKNFWYIDLIGNYYDNIYLYFAPISRRETEVPKDLVNGVKTYNAPDQNQGKGGFMLDASIGKTFRLKQGKRIGFNLMLTNILNNINICTGGMEQNRLDTKQEAERTNNAYRFQQSPRKFYANGTNGMLLINYQF